MKKIINKIMTIEEVSGYLKTSKYTIYRLIKDKAIPASRVGKQWRFHREQIDQWFTSQCVTNDENQLKQERQLEETAAK